MAHYSACPKKESTVGLFLQYFLHCYHILEICHKGIIKYPTTSQRVTTLTCEKLMSENYRVAQIKRRHFTFQIVYTFLLVSCSK